MKITSKQGLSDISVPMKNLIAETVVTLVIMRVNFGVKEPVSFFDSPGIYLSLNIVNF